MPFGRGWSKCSICGRRLAYAMVSNGEGTGPVYVQFCDTCDKPRSHARFCADLGSCALDEGHDGDHESVTGERWPA